jgi:hypothetical protein
MVCWEKLPCHPGKGRGISFWAYIDTKLDKLRAVCAKQTKEATEAATKALVIRFLKSSAVLIPSILQSTEGEPEE